MSRSPTSLYTPPLSPRRHHQRHIVGKEEGFSSSAVILRSADTGVGLLHTAASAFNVAGAFFSSHEEVSVHSRRTGKITAKGKCEMYPSFKKKLE